MKKLLCAVGSILYSVIAGYLIWLLFFFLTNWAMTFELLGVFLTVILGFSIIGGFVSILTNIILAPLVAMLTASPSIRWFPVIVMGLFGFSSVALPWRAVVWGNGYNIVMAVILSIMALMVFGVYVASIYKIKEITENN